MKVGKEETSVEPTSDGVFLGVLPCSGWMLGTRISSATLISSLVMGKFFSSLLPKTFSYVLVIAFPMVC